MNGFWSAWVIVLIVFNLGVSLFLFLWGPRVAIPTLEDGTTGHVWAHGMIREGLHKLPLWWLLISAGLFVACFSYLILYPGFGSSKGVLDWTSHQQLSADVAANNAKLDPLMQRFAPLNIEELALDPEAIRIGRRLFVDNCAACHGREGLGNMAVGAPDLTDNVWLYGGDGDAIMTSITEGRHGVMPAFGGQFDAAGISDLAHYVMSLSGGSHLPSKAARGKSMFGICSACHGVDGKGNAALGAPNLTAGAWLYGDNLTDIENTIRNGRGGTMPAWRSRIDAPHARLIAAWIYAQSHFQEASQN